jgi:hypothetical protein
VPRAFESSCKIEPFSFVMVRTFLDHPIPEAVTAAEVARALITTAQWYILQILLSFFWGARENGFTHVSAAVFLRSGPVASCTPWFANLAETRETNVTHT